MEYCCNCGIQPVDEDDNIITFIKDGKKITGKVCMICYFELEEVTEDEDQELLIRAGVDPIDDVDTGNMLDVIRDLQTRIDAALDNIESYIPEFIYTEGEGDASDGQVRPQPGREYHPKSSVDSFRDDLTKILKGERDA